MYTFVLALKSTRKTKWLFNKDGKRNHFEDGTTIQGYKVIFVVLFREEI